MKAQQEMKYQMINEEFLTAQRANVERVVQTLRDTPTSIRQLANNFRVPVESMAAHLSEARARGLAKPTEKGWVRA